MWIENRGREMWKRKHKIEEGATYAGFRVCFHFVALRLLLLAFFLANRMEHNKFNAMQMCTKCKVVHLHWDQKEIYTLSFSE